jgi:hypothetical protein
MQESEELRALGNEKKISREGKVKIKICVWKKERKKYNIYVYERMKESD